MTGICERLRALNLVALPYLIGRTPVILQLNSENQ